MSYYSENKNIKETVKNKTVAIATHDVGADIIVKALNLYFERGTFTKNEAVEMMNRNTSNSLNIIIDDAKKF